MNNKLKKFGRILLIRAGLPKRRPIDHPLHCPPPLNLKYTQALLDKAGYPEVKIYDCMIRMISEKLILEDIEQKHRDVVLLDISSAAFDHGHRLSQRIKKIKDVLIVAAGSDVSERYPYYLKHPESYDILLRGEFEEEFCTLIKKLSQGGAIEKIKDFYNKEKITQVFNINSLDILPTLPWSAKELNRYPYRYPLKIFERIVSGYISTSRGCRHACTFCSPSVRKTYGHKLRLRRANDVVDEIEYLQELGVNLISFEDDDFTGSAEHVSAVCLEILRRKIKISWACHARIDEVNPDLLRRMKRAGCLLILFGIESGSEQIIHALHKVPNHKAWRTLAINTFDQARQTGIATCALFIVGSPSETWADIQQSINLAVDLKPDFIKVHNFTLYPGSSDYKKYHKDKSSYVSQHHYLPPIMNVSQMSAGELKRAQLRFYRKFFFRPEFLWVHFYRYFLFYLYNWKWSFKMLQEIIFFLIMADKSRAEGSQT